MTQYPFLSDEWLDEARSIRAEFKGKSPAIPVSVRMNQIIQEVPFGDGTIHAHVDTSSGELEMETGHLESPDLTITIAYSTATATPRRPCRLSSVAKLRSTATSPR